MAADARRGAALRLALFALVGAIAGYLFHRLVGCPGGGCPITGNPFVSTAYGAVVAVVLGLGVLPSRRGGP